MIDFYLNLIAGNRNTCFKTGNYLHNNIDSVKNVNDAPGCQKICQEHSQCKFWTYNSYNKKCFPQTEEAPTALGTCSTCVHGPRFCQGEYVFSENISERLTFFKNSENDSLIFYLLINKYLFIEYFSQLSLV